VKSRCGAGPYPYYSVIRGREEARDPETNVTDDDLSLTDKIALAHLSEFPDYYTQLAELAAEACTYWAWDFFSAKSGSAL
jgi:hypothetical protein